MVGSKVSRLLAGIIGITLIIVVLPAPVSAKNTQMSADFPVSQGIMASFGFELQSNPDSVWTMAGDNVDISYTPAPAMAIVLLNIPDFLESIDEYNLAELYRDNILLEDFQDVELPIYEAPIGSEELGSFPIVDILGAIQLTLDISLTASIDAAITSNEGHLSTSTVHWTGFESQSVTLSNINSDATVQFHDAMYNVVLTISGNIKGLAGLIEYPIVTVDIPLGSVSMGGNVETKVKLVEDEMMRNSWFDILIGVVIGGLIGVVIGFLGGRSKPKAPVAYQQQPAQVYQPYQASPPQQQPPPPPGYYG
jgi:hypothetical protein